MSFRWIKVPADKAGMHFCGPDHEYISDANSWMDKDGMIEDQDEGVRFYLASLCAMYTVKKVLHKDWAN